MPIQADMRTTTHRKLYFWLLVSIAVSLPLSKALISITPFLLLLNWLVEGGLREKMKVFFRNPSVWLLPAVFLLYLVGLLWTDSLKWGIHDLKIQVPLLILPLVIGTSGRITRKELTMLLQFFSAAVVVASLCSVFVLLGFSGKEIRDARDISLFISHIRFALLINISIFSLGWLGMSAGSLRQKLIYGGIVVWLVLFLFVLRSMTGIVVFVGMSAAWIMYRAFQTRHLVLRFSLFVFLLMIPVFIGAYLTRSINRFYAINEPSESELAERTDQGNLYHHDLNNRQLENGQYVFLFICEEELREAWNKRGRTNYDSTGVDGYNKYALFRYLTSKGLRKDAGGLSHLADTDIANIEKGIPNYRFANPISLDNRIYQTIWEFDMYQKGGNPAGSSVVQRFEYYKIAWSVIREHFWFGAGTGGYFPAYEKKFDAHPFFKDEKFRQRSHNMLLSYWVDFGLIGLLFVCFAYGFPVFRERQYSFLMLMLLFVVGLSCMNEDTLNNHDAIVFFSLFYPLFLFSKYGSETID